jgi:uncharacterized membrane protein YfcA
MSGEMILGIVAAGVLVGVMSALFGVGGGILMVPFMVLALGEEQHLAEGTSLLVILPTAVTGVLAHRRRGYVSFHTGMLLALGGSAGAWVGALLALRLSADSLQIAFGILLAVSGIRVIRRGVANLRSERAVRPPESQSGVGTMPSPEPPSSPSNDS